MQNSEKGLHLRIKPQTAQLYPLSGWSWVGERGLRIATGDATLGFYMQLVSLKMPEIEDIIPADGCLLLILRLGAPVSDGLRAALAALSVDTQAVVGKLHEIPVEYGGAAGPDLPALAALAGLDEAAYIERHAGADYRVAFLGFQPGFPYLSGLPEGLHAPRRSSPRVRVAAGSVAVGGAYSGIYPASGPGGWNIIGRTEVTLFDPRRDTPALLMPGDRVRFVPS